MRRLSRKLSSLRAGVRELVQRVEGLLAFFELEITVPPGAAKLVLNHRSLLSGLEAVDGLLLEAFALGEDVGAIEQDQDELLERAGEIRRRAGRCFREADAARMGDRLDLARLLYTRAQQLLRSAEHHDKQRDDLEDDARVSREATDDLLAKATIELEEWLETYRHLLGCRVHGRARALSTQVSSSSIRPAASSRCPARGLSYQRAPS